MNTLRRVERIGRHCDRVEHGAGRAAGLDRQIVVVDLGVVVAEAGGQGQASHRARFQLGFEAIALHRIGVEQQVGVGAAADRRQLQILGLEDNSRSG